MSDSLKPFEILDSSERVYLDHNATSPLAQELKPKIMDWLDAWGNPSSIHRDGRRPKTLMREARANISKMINVDPLELIFTSGGSEANNLALKGLFETNLLRKSNRQRYLVGSLEHPSLKKAAESLQSKGAEILWIPVLRSGAVDLESYANMLNDSTALVSMMLANNETGNIFPIGKMAKMAHEVGALFHTDAVQALGKIEIDLPRLHVDLASFAGHKFYALKGSGFLFTRKGLNLEPLICGGGQERHRRGGTENVLAIASLGEMCKRKAEVLERGQKMQMLRDQLECYLKKTIPGLSITGAESPRLPSTSSMLIPGIDGEILLMNLDMRGYSVSTGAACSSGSPEPSPVLLGMGLTRYEAQSSLRVGIGWSTTEKQLVQFAQTLQEVVKHLRKLNQYEGELESEESLKFDWNCATSCEESERHARQSLSSGSEELQ